MRNVYFHDQDWFFSGKGNFQGLRTGCDACAEHEWGMKGIQEAFGLDLSLNSLERFRPTKKPETLHFFHADLKEDRYIGIILQPNKLYNPLDIAQEFECYNWDDEPVIAWDERSFLIMVPESKKKYVKAVKALWEALKNNDVWLGGDFGRPYRGTGIGFYLSSKMPKENVDAASQKLAENAKN